MNVRVSQYRTEISTVEFRLDNRVSEKSQSGWGESRQF